MQELLYLFLHVVVLNSSTYMLVSGSIVIVIGRAGSLSQYHVLTIEAVGEVAILELVFVAVVGAVVITVLLM